jgi:hypothetical protein
LNTLLPLRVPSGWAILFNILADMPDVSKLSSKDRENWLSDDIFSAVTLKLDPRADGWLTWLDGPRIDVSWRDPADPEGRYVVTVTLHESGPHASFQTRLTASVGAAIEATMLLLQRSANIHDFEALYSSMAQDTI